jgi:hypothetical protein
VGALVVKLVARRGAGAWRKELPIHSLSAELLYRRRLLIAVSVSE